jgi:hypothetical protein
MKKYFLFLTLLFTSIFTFAQKQTTNRTFHKIKIGHEAAYADGMEKHNTKFFPISNSHAIVIWNITGGKHDGERMISDFNSRSFEERDIPWTRPEGQSDSWNINVAPHLESVQTEVLVFIPEFSNSKVDDDKGVVEKVIQTEYTVMNYSKAGNDIRMRFPKVFDKLGWKMKIFATVTGESRVIVSRRLPNGWKDLDAMQDFGTAYDEIYGKGSYEKDDLIMNNYWRRTDRWMMTRNKALSSK